MPREALLVIDMCKDFVDGRLPVGEPAKAIVPFIVAECQEMLDAGGLVYFPTDNHEDGKDGQWPDHCDPTTDGADLYGAIGEWFEKNRRHDPKGIGYFNIPQVQSHVRYIPKTTYNAFWGTSIQWELKDMGVDTVKIVGVCTDICVFHSAAGAYFSGFKVKVLKQGCATLDFLKGNEPQAYEMMKGQFAAEIVD